MLTTQQTTDDGRAELNGLTTVINAATETPNTATATAVVTIRPFRYLRINVAVNVLAVIAIVCALYWGRAFFVPLLVGILASYTLSPMVDWLKFCYIPRALGAAIVMGVLIGGFSWLGFSLSDDAAAMIDKLPEATRKLRQQLHSTNTEKSALQNIQEATKQLEGVATDAGSQQGKKVADKQNNDASISLHNYVVTQYSLLFAAIAQAPIVLLLTYFLLSSGAHFRNKILTVVGPSLFRKKEMVCILDGIEIQIQLYLFTMLISSVMIGVSVWLAYSALGMEQPALWGVSAAILQFIPYLGPALLAFSGGLVSFIQFNSLPHALATSTVTLMLTVAVGVIFTTWIQSRFAKLNPTVLFIALLFFAWLWGVWGLLLGAPLVAIAKVICDHVEALKPLGELLGS
ncbi:MAG: AI-2E family transporter [Gallionellaceae bacterium]|jgi:predicted PurR-regulated permease PerM